MAFWLYIALAALAVLLVTALLSTIRLRIRYSRSGRQDHLVVIVRALFGAYRYRLTVPAIMIRGMKFLYEKKASQSIAGASASSQQKWREGTGLIRKWNRFKPWLQDSLKNVECTRFRLDIRVGTGDAPSTAVASGLLWSVYGVAIGLASRMVSLKTRPYGGVEPVYQGAEFSLVWEADFRIRVLDFLRAVMIFTMGSMRYRGSWKSWIRWLKGPQSA